jgi:signal transduction histidine kinase
MLERAALALANQSAESVPIAPLSKRARVWLDIWRDWSHNWPPDYDAPAIRHRIESHIANARVVLAGVILLGAWLDPDEPARWHAVVYGLGAGYFIYSLVLLLKVRASLPARPMINLIHVVDLVFPIVLIAFTAGPRSPYFILLSFSFLFGAMRWGMAGALLAGAIGVTAWMLIGVASLSGVGAYFGWGAAGVPAAYFLRASYVVITPLLIGYLLEGRRRVNVEEAVLGNFLRLASSSEAVVERVQLIFTEGLRLFPCRRLLLAVQDSPGGRAWLWEFDPPRRGGSGELATVRYTLLKSAAWPVYLGSRPGPVWQAPLAPSDPLALYHQCERLAGCDVTLGGDIYGRILLLDPKDYPLPLGRLRLLERIGTQLAPLLLNEYLLAQLRRLGAEQERRHLALELHDGVLQSLCGLELEVEAARRSVRDPADDAQRFDYLRRHLNDASLDVRRLMGELHDQHPDGDSVPVAIRRLAARMQRETGIRIDLHGIDDIQLASRRMARDLPAMVQEALVNVRKHANAQQVDLSYVQVDRQARLAIRDDGKGYPLDGALSGVELETWEHAPSVLLARARQIGAQVTVTSAPGSGTTVELSWSVGEKPGAPTLVLSQPPFRYQSTSRSTDGV